MKLSSIILLIGFISSSVIGQTHFSFTSNTGGNATVAVQTSINPTVNGVTLSSGDEVGAFTPAGLCVGAIVWNNANTALTVWGDNDQTGQIDGIQSGQKISFRIWDQSANIEYANVNAAFDANPPFISTGLYSANGLYRLTSLSAAPDIPVTPTLSSPANNAVDQSISPTLSWNAASGAATYRLLVATDANFSNVVVDDATLNTTSKQVSSLSNSTKYYWKVSATNVGGTSNYSDVWNFTTIIAVAATPTLSSPANNAVDQSVSPTLSWNASTGAATYRLVVATDANFTNVVVDDATLTTTLKQVGQLSNSTKYYWKVSATNAGGTSSFSEVWNFTTIIAVASAPTLSSPANNAVDQSVSPTLSWNASTGAATYRLLVATDANFSNVVVDDATLTTTSKQVGPLSNSAKYYWKVSATNAGGTSSFSDVWNFTTIIAAASAPTLSLPANDAVDQSVSPTLSWNASTGAATYRLQVATDANFTNVIVDDATLTTTSKQVDPLSNSTKYYWKVSATNAGGTSAFSEVWNFTTIIAVASTPALSSPANNAVDQSISPTLSWNASTGAATYRLLVATDANFSNIIVDDATLTTTSKQLGPLSNSTKYYWKVSATNTGGTSAFSEVWNFTTIIAVASAPTLSLPANNAVNQVINPTLTWNASTGAATYRLLVATDANFSNVLVDDATLTTTLKQVGPLSNSVKYFWKVCATNAGGTSAVSEVWNFTTIIAAASAPTLSLPANNAVDQSVSPTLSWNASSGAATYRLLVATDANFTNVIVDDATLTTTSKQLDPLSNSTKYYWKVSATNAGGTSAFSDVWNFTTIIAVASVPTLSLPANNAVDQSVSPTLSWNASTGVATYRLVVARDANFTDVVFNDSTLTAASKQISSLSNSTKYYWKVNAKNAGGTSAFSEVWNFTTIIAAASAPTLSLPANNAVDQSVSPTLSWNASSGATTYRLLVATDANFTNVIVDDATLTTTSKQLGQLSNSTKYYWKVSATNAGGTSAFSDVWNFTTIIAIASAPTLSSPTNDAVDQSINPTLTWNAVTDAATYRLVVAKDANFADVVFNDSTLTTASKQISSLSNSTKYYWKVSATNAGGTSAFSDVWNFTTIIAVAATPTLSSPSNNAVDQTINPTLTWSASIGAATYRLVVATDANFSNVLVDDATLTTTSKQVGPLSNSAKYYWKVSATNAGGTSAFSEVWNFTTVPKPINTPTNLLAISTKIKKVNLSWEDNSDNELNFILQRKEGDSLSASEYSTVAVIQANQTGYLDSVGFKDATKYTYRIYAANADTVSDYSNQAEVYTIVPVELTSFIAKASEDKILLEWTTATERNNNGFEIERKLSTENNLPGSWAKISFIKGKGTTTEKTNYNFVDEFRFLFYKGEIGYRLKQIDYDGTSTYSDEININADFTPKEISLEQNFPNPFNPATIIKYALPYEGRVTVTIYNTLGEILKTFNEEIKAAGYYDINFNGEGLSSGVYFYRLSAESLDGKQKYSSIKKMILLK